MLAIINERVHEIMLHKTMTAISVVKLCEIGYQVNFEY